MTVYEQVLAGLQTKFTGVDTATLTRIATSKAEGVTDESQVKTIIDGVSFTDVLTNYGDARADEATRTSIKNYEKKNGLKDGKPIDGKSGDGKDGNEGSDTSKDGAQKDGADQEQIPAWAKSLIKSNKTLNEKLECMTAEKSEQEFSARVAAAAKKYGINENLAGMLNVPKDADLDKFMQTAKQNFADAGFKEVVPPASAAQQVKTESEAFAKAITDGTQTIAEQKK